MPNIHLNALDKYINESNFSIVQNDIAAINNLLKELTRSPRQIRDRTDLAKLILQSNLRLVVARDIDKNPYEGPNIVGIATIHWIELPTKIKAYIDDVVVSKDYRGQQIGKKLILKLIQIAREVGAKCIDLTSNPTRVEANTMYQKLGFEKKDTNYYRLKL